jgi:integrase
MRVLPLPDFALQALHTYRANQRKQLLASGKQNLLNLLYPTDSGGYYWGASVSRAFTVFARKVGFTITFHGLRHTGATFLLESGVDPKTVSERLGHSDVAFTMNIYGHVTKKMKDRSANTLNRLFTDQQKGKNEAI